VATLLKGGALFLHVPKTGGTFLRKLFVALDLVKINFARDHSDMRRTLHVSKHHPGSFLYSSLRLGRSVEREAKRSFKFCFVRHPFTWYESCWQFMEDLGWQLPLPPPSRFGFYNDPWHPLEPVAQAADKDFNSFMRKMTRQHPGYLTRLYEQYAPAGWIDFVGRQENLIADARHILDHLKVNYDESIFSSLGRVNASKTLRPVWSEENKKMICELEKGVFEKYGYETG